MQLLQGAKLDADLTDNPIGISTSQSINGLGFGDGIIDNEYFSLESSIGYTSSNPFFPNGSIQHYNVCKGLKNDGSNQTVGNTGIITKFYYPGNTDPLFYATNGVDPGIFDDELTLLNPKGDRLIYGSSGPFTFSTNEKNRILTSIYSGGRFSFST
jgi:hypothetical protein